MKYPKEFEHVYKILDFGAKKYDPEGWLEPEGYSMDIKSQAGSMQRHLAQGLYGNPMDKESGHHHMLHLACRALMCYTRYIRGIKHPKDD